MSKRHVVFFLVDALVALEKIESLVRLCDDGLALRRDSMRYYAVLKLFEIVGEATRFFMNDSMFEQVKDASWPSVVAFRNLVVHEYFGINYEDLFRIARINVPELRKQFERLCFIIKRDQILQTVLEDAKTDLIKNWEKESAEYVQKLLNKLYPK